MKRAGDDSAPSIRPVWRVPVYWAALGVLCGQIAGAEFRPALIAGAAMVVLGVGSLAWRRSACLLWIAAMAGVIGAFQLDRVVRPRLGPHHIARRAGTAVRVRGHVLAAPVQRTGGVRFLLWVENVWHMGRWERAEGRVSATVRRVGRPWRRGDRFEGPLRLRRPRNFGNPGEFDYEGYMARRGLFVTGFWTDDKDWQREVGSRSNLRGVLDAWREEVAAVVGESMTGTARSVMAALLIGDRGGLDGKLRERYARAGASHILAISGLHVGLVGGAAYGASRWLMARSEWLLLSANVPKLATAFAGVAVLLYAGLAGGSVATTRAVAMVALLVAATLLDRRRDWLAGLAVVALGMSLIWPGSVFEISFQLSFMAVLAIVLGMRRITAWWDARAERKLSHLRRPSWRLARRLVLYQAVSACALAGTAPLAAWHFNRISVIAVISNLVLVPLLGFFPVGIGLLAALLTLVCRQPAVLLMGVAGQVIRLADRLVTLFGSLPGAAMRVVTPSLFELGLIYAALAALLLPGRRVRRRVLCVCCALLAGDAGYWHLQRCHRGDLRVTFLSVGQGDSSVIEFPGSAVMVIDGGGLSRTFDVGERVVGPYLWSRKIRSVDTLVLTHPQFDHYGGLTFLMRAFAPREFWWNGMRSRSARFDTLVMTAQEKHVRLRTVRRGFHRVIDGVDVRVLGPASGPGGDVNNQSVVVRLRYGATTLLFPGDLEAAGEHRLLRFGEAELASTVLKVPHHGSRTSSTPAFLDVVAPRLAVVSVGYDNRFGMPDPEVLTAYRARGSVIRRTDLDGAVVLEVSAAGVLRAFTGRKRGADQLVPCS